MFFCPPLNNVLTSPTKRSKHVVYTHTHAYTHHESMTRSHFPRGARAKCLSDSIIIYKQSKTHCHQLSSFLSHSRVTVVAIHCLLFSCTLIISLFIFAQLGLNLLCESSSWHNNNKWKEENRCLV